MMSGDPTEQNMVTLANSELAVMKLLWEGNVLTARALRERLYGGASKSQHGTIQRLLQRLEDKGFVGRDVSAGAHEFSARISQEEYSVSQMEALAGRLSSGSFAPLISHLVELNRISDSEMSRIQEILAAERSKEKR